MNIPILNKDFLNLAILLTKLVDNSMNIIKKLCSVVKDWRDKKKAEEANLELGHTYEQKLATMFGAQSQKKDEPQQFPKA